jgi:hypothetical protein
MRFANGVRLVGSTFGKMGKLGFTRLQEMMSEDENKQ